MDRYDHNAHSVFLLYYHLILVVKYRRKVFTNEISDRAKEIFCYIAPRYGLMLEEWTANESRRLQDAFGACRSPGLFLIRGKLLKQFSEPCR